MDLKDLSSFLKRSIRSLFALEKLKRCRLHLPPYPGSGMLSSGPTDTAVISTTQQVLELFYIIAGLSGRS